MSGKGSSCINAKSGCAALPSFLTMVYRIQPQWRSPSFTLSWYVFFTGSPVTYCNLHVHGFEMSEQH